MIPTNKIYPVYTSVEQLPQTICQELKSEVFEYPFFNDGVALERTNNKNNYKAQDLSISTDEDLLELKGIIFHTSHCGSTLLTRMLNQAKNTRIVSESEAINGLLLSKILFDLSEKETIEKLIKIVNLYQQNTGSARFLILKLTSWNVFLIQLFQKAFPSVKWIYIDRTTDDLLGSLMKRDGGFIDWWDHPVDRVRRKFVGKLPDNILKQDYLLAMINMQRKNAKNSENNNGLFVKYPDFIKQYEDILRHFDLNLTLEELTNSKKMVKYESKFKEKILFPKNIT